MGSKLRDKLGNDFIVPCAFLAEILFFARFKRNSNPKSASDSSIVKKLSNQFYSSAMTFWKEMETIDD